VTTSSTAEILTTVAPGEVVGRETLSRFDMQFQAAAFAALEILDGNGVVCVFCDFQDDFVVKRVNSGEPRYHFFQVKTKKKLNHQWSLLEVFALKKKGQGTDAESLKKIRLSFAGKLLEHGVRFGNACAAVTLLSNVHFDDDVEAVVEEWQNYKGSNKHGKLIFDNFSLIYLLNPKADEFTVKRILSKFSIRGGVNHIGEDREQFVNAARSAIFKYSEVDLDYYEVTDLATNLLDKVFQKSKGALSETDVATIEKRAGITLEDLLGTLSISPVAYSALLAGEDQKIIKTASILQRVLKAAGAGPRMIEFASAQKVEWDIWFRNARHNYGEFDLAMLLEKLDSLYRNWQLSGASFESLDNLVVAFLSDSFAGRFSGLTKELVLGGLFSALVRSFSK
jgi:transcriptional regulator with XRE-family HTH domain